VINVQSFKWHSESSIRMADIELVVDDLHIRQDFLGVWNHVHRDHNTHYIEFRRGLATIPFNPPDIRHVGERIGARKFVKSNWDNIVYLREEPTLPLLLSGYEHEDDRIRYAKLEESALIDLTRRGNDEYGTTIIYMDGSAGEMFFTTILRHLNGPRVQVLSSASPTEIDFQDNELGKLGIFDDPDRAVREYLLTESEALRNVLGQDYLIKTAATWLTDGLKLSSRLYMGTDLHAEPASEILPAFEGLVDSVMPEWKKFLGDEIQQYSVAFEPAEEYDEPGFGF